MVKGSRTYYLPGSDVEVEVFYRIEFEDISFDYACIEELSLNCNVLGVLVDDTKKEDLIKTTKYITLAQWFQRELDKDVKEIFEDEEITITSDYDEHFNQKAFVWER